MDKVMIVAEPGVTHEGDLGRMLALIDLVAAAGVDACKFQWCSDPEALARRRAAPEYLPHYQWLRFPIGWHDQLAQRCRARNIGYACTAYLPPDVAVLDPYIDFYKVAAFEATARDLFEAYAALMPANDKRLVVSLGLGATVADTPAVDQARERYAYLHCVSAYPVPVSELNLGRIAAEQLDGLSDHTAASDPQVTLVGALAVAAGATWIERHVRLEDCRPSNPDYAVALGSHQLTAYVENVRVAQTARTPIAAPTPSEEPMRRHRARPERGR